MKKIQDVVTNIVSREPEALYALTHGFMNLSAYAKQINSAVADEAMKEVTIPSIVVALSRTQKILQKENGLLQKVTINNISTKSPLSEIVYQKSPDLLKKLSSFYEVVEAEGDDFLTVTMSTNDISIICSDRLRDCVLKHFTIKPRLMTDQLASLGITFDPRYYEMPNVGYTLMYQIARKKIILAEIVSTHTEMIFIFDKKYLVEAVDAFSEKV